MADIRPASSGLPGSPAAPARPVNPARSAAQRAFFQQALGQAQAAPGAAPVAAPARPVQAQTVQPTRVVEQPVNAEQPQRYLRPGSLLDIKV